MFLLQAKLLGDLVLAVEISYQGRIILTQVMRSTGVENATQPFEPRVQELPLLDPGGREAEPVVVGSSGGSGGYPSARPLVEPTASGGSGGYPSVPPPVESAPSMGGSSSGGNPILRIILILLLLMVAFLAWQVFKHF